MKLFFPDINEEAFIGHGISLTPKGEAEFLFGTEEEAINTTANRKNVYVPGTAILSLFDQDGNTWSGSMELRLKLTKEKGTK